MLLRKLTGNPLFAGTLAAMLLIVPLGQVYLLFPLQMLVPLPIYLAALRSGGQAGVLAALFPALFCLVFLGSSSYPLVLVYGALIWFPILAAWLIGGGWRISQILAGGYFVTLLLLVLFLIGSFATDNVLLEAVYSHLSEGKEAVLATMTASPQKDAQMVVQVGENLDKAFRLFSQIFPAMFLSSWFVIQAGNLLLVRHLLLRWEMPLVAPEKLTDLRIPFVLIWPLIGFGLLAVASFGDMLLFSMNLALFLAIPYSFQGVSVVQKGFQHYNISAFVRVIFYFLLMTWSVVFFSVTVLGIFDTWADFRSRMNRGDTSSPL